MLSNHPNCLGGNGPSASSDLIGDVDGPASATDNAVARFDGTTGKLIQNSTVTIADTTGDIAGATSLTSPASTNLTLGLGTGGTALTLASSTLAATFAGNLTVSGNNVGVGVSSNVAVGVFAAGTFAQSTAYGVASQVTFASPSNVNVAAIYGAITTSAAAFTAPITDGVLIGTPTLGASSAITTNSGVRIANQGAAGITNAYGIDIAAQSGAATTNIGLRNAGITSLTNTTASTGSTSGALQVAGGIYAGAASVFGGSATVNGQSGTGNLYVLDNSASGIAIERTSATVAKYGIWIKSGGDAVFADWASGNGLTLTKTTGAATFAGVVLHPDGTAAAPSISFSSDTDTGFYSSGGNTLRLSIGGTQQFRFDTSGSITGGTVANYLQLASTGAVSLVAAGTNQNITLTPSGTGAVDGRSNVTTGNFISSNVTNTAQWSFGRDSVSTGDFVFCNNTNGRIAGFTTGGRLLIGTTTDSGALLQVGTNTTTSAGGMIFGNDVGLYRSDNQAIGIAHIGGANPLFHLIEGTTKKFQLGTSSGDVYFDSLTVGKSLYFRSGNQVLALTLDSSQNATFAQSVGIGAGNAFLFTGRSAIQSASDGVLRISNNAGTDFTRLQFGGTTSSFPAIKRNSTRFQFILADDSGFTTVDANDFSSQGAATVVGAGKISYGGTTAITVGAAGGASALPATPTGYVIINVAGTNMKVPYYAS